MTTLPRSNTSATRSRLLDEVRCSSDDSGKKIATESGTAHDRAASMIASSAFIRNVFGNRHVDRQVSGLGTPKANKKSRPGLASTIPGRLLERSRRSPTFAPKHYHGPGGLNGRVRNGNGCDPAGMVAGKPAGGLSGRAGRDSAVVSHRHKVFTPHQK